MHSQIIATLVHNNLISVQYLYGGALIQRGGSRSLVKFGWISSVGLHVHGEIKFVGLVLSGIAGVLYLLIFTVPYSKISIWMNEMHGGMYSI